MAEGEVVEITSMKDYRTALEAPGVVIVDCFAVWCGPCKVIAPKVAELAREFTNARFYKVDVDEVPDVAQELGIRAMPTFKFFKDGEMIDDVVGANPPAIKAAVEKALA